MTNKEIKKTKQEVYEIQKMPDSRQQLEPIKVVAGRSNALIMPVHPSEEQKKFIYETIRNIHTVLQTEEMFNACVSAKWSCFWAAVAAISSLLSLLVILFLR